ncbi:MAG TPA: oligosaccharide flippase family protein [Terriglobales bacterium]|nr:oligosaccharide flippase family protein [Terriglobales bacterium]
MQSQGEQQLLSPEAMTAPVAGSATALRARVLSGSMIMLVSSAVVGATNLIYNIAIARVLGASEFGQATAIYTVLMLLSSVTLAFQLVCSKFVAKNTEMAAKAAVYKGLHGRSWQIGIAVGVILVYASSIISNYLNLPTRNYVVLLGIGTAFYIPLGVRRGLMQGLYHFRQLAENFVLEVFVKLGGALLLLHYGYGVSGVIVAVVASVVVAYVAGSPRPAFNVAPRLGMPASFSEGMQAIIFFIGQVIINNIDIVLVKHFFPAGLAGLYAAIALVGRVVYMLSWSVISSMFPVSAGSSQERSGRAVLSTALLLVVIVASLFTMAVWLAPEKLWLMILGHHFMVNYSGSFSELLVLYAALTGLYSFSVVIMTYEMSRRIANTSWLQLGVSGAIAVGIYIFHSTLHDVIAVQLVLMIFLLVAVSVPFVRAHRGRAAEASGSSHLRRLKKLRLADEDEVVAEFLKAEFYQPEFDHYRDRFFNIVHRPDLNNKRENTIRRALLFRRRGRMWRELPPDTQWWRVQLDSNDIPCIRAFPRKQWRTFAEGNFYLADMIERIRKRVEGPEGGKFSLKMRGVAADLEQNLATNSVLLIGVDDYSPLTIIEGNHRMAAAMLVNPLTVHERFKFYCGLSPRMTECCWYQTDFVTLSRYATNIVRYMFHDRDFFIQRILRGELSTSDINEA